MEARRTAVTVLLRIAEEGGYSGVVLDDCL